MASKKKGSISEGFISTEEKKRLKQKLLYVMCTELKRKNKKPEAVWKVFLRHSGENFKKLYRKGRLTFLLKNPTQNIKASLLST